MLSKNTCEKSDSFLMQRLKSSVINTLTGIKEVRIVPVDTFAVFIESRNEVVRIEGDIEEYNNFGRSLWLIQDYRDICVHIILSGSDGRELLICSKVLNPVGFFSLSSLHSNTAKTLANSRKQV